MTMGVRKVIVHTDILVDYLLHARSAEHLLRRAMRKLFCYTTVFNAMELFSLARTAAETEAVASSMSAMKILGLNARSAKSYGRLLSKGPALPRMNALIAGLALESRLPVLTGLPGEFRGVRGLTLLRPDDV